MSEDINIIYRDIISINNGQINIYQSDVISNSRFYEITPTKCGTRYKDENNLRYATVTGKWFRNFSGRRSGRLFNRNNR